MKVLGVVALSREFLRRDDRRMIEGNFGVGKFEEERVFFSGRRGRTAVARRALAARRLRGGIKVIFP